MTTVLVLVILGLIWGFVLIPPYLQSRRESRPGDSIASFRQQLNVLERTTPGAPRSNLARLDVGRADLPRNHTRGNVAQLAARRPYASPSAAAQHRADVRQRRRDVFVTLLAAAGLTLLLALVMGGPLWMVHLVVDAALVAYVAMLVSIQQQRTERERTVRPMPQAAPVRRRQAPPAPQLALRRYGS